MDYQVQQNIHKHHIFQLDRDQPDHKRPYFNKDTSGTW